MDTYTLTMLITEDALIRAFAAEGVAVVETLEGMDGGVVAWYSHERLIVAVHPGMLSRQRVAALAHEWCHHARGDAGCQGDAIEARIDEDVALMLVPPGEYAFWEGELGWSTGGIASALGLPRWVIEAYRRVLASDLRASSRSVESAQAELGLSLRIPNTLLTPQHSCEDTLSWT